MSSIRRPGTRRRRSTALVALATAGVLALSGCGGASDADGGGSGKGGDLTFLLDSLGSTWVPNSASFSSFQGNVFSQVYDKLVYVDGQGKVSPWIARSWTHNPTYTEFTLKLRPGVTFSDGEKLDAAAVVANLDYWAHGQPDKGIAPIGLFPKSYRAATAVDDTTVKVSFTAPTLGFVSVLGYAGSTLYAPTALRGSATRQADLSTDYGSGPYTVTSWKSDDSVVLTRRRAYAWGPAASGNSGPAHLDRITYKVSADPAVRTAAVQAGQAQVAYNPTPQQITQLTAKGLKVYTPVYLGFAYGWALNTRTPLFRDARVRQAVQHGIDRRQILDTVYTPQWKPATSFFNDTVPGAVDESAHFRYDPTLSARLLRQAGWTRGSDGTLTKGGRPAELTLYANPYLPTSKQVDQLIASQLGRLGIKVSVQAYDVITYGEKVVLGNPSVAAYEITRSIGDASTAANVFTDADKGENWFGLGSSDKTLDRLRDQISGATDPGRRDAALAQLQRHVLDRGYFIPLTQIVQRPVLATPTLEGAVQDSTAFTSFRNATLG